jgi:tetratricopeptide (TPR) repeat protein
MHNAVTTRGYYGLALAMVVSWLMMGVLTAEAAPYKAGIQQTVTAAGLQALRSTNLAATEAQLMAQMKARPNTTTQAKLAVVQAELYKLGAAERNARAVLDKHPDWAWPHFALGKALWYRTTSSDMTYRAQAPALMQEAYQHLQQAAQLEPNVAEIHNSMGELALAMGQGSAAVEAFDQALRADPNHTDALTNKASALAQQGRLNEALPVFNQAIARNTKYPRPYILKGQALARAGQAHEAINTLNTALVFNKHNEVLHNALGEAYQTQGNMAAAMKSYKQAVAIKPEYTAAYENLGNLLNLRGDGELALSELKTALNAKPNHTPYMNQIGDILVSVDKPEQAVEYFQRSLSFNPQDAEAAKGLASAYQRSAERLAATESLMGEEALIKAEQRLAEAIRLNPNNLELRLALLKVQKATGAPMIDDTSLRQLAAQPANNTDEQVRRLEALLALGEFQAADQQRQQLMGNVNQPQQLTTLGHWLAKAGDTEGARLAYQQVLTTQPNDVSAVRGLYRLDKLEAHAVNAWNQAKASNHWYSKKDRMSAKVLYEEALDLNPRLAEARLEVAKLYYKNGDYPAAIRSFKAYEQLQPNMTEAERASISRAIAVAEARQRGELGLKERWPF